MPAAVDLFATQVPTIDSASLYFDNVTPSDTVDLPYISRQITVGTSGTLKVTRTDGITVTIPSAVIAVEPVQTIRATRVWATGTTASNIFYKP